MKFIARILTFLIVFVSLSSLSQELETENGYISEELFIYMHAGPGTNYKILGSVNAGSQIRITANVQNGYTQVQDARERLGWIESKYVSKTPSMAIRYSELEQELNDQKNELALIKNQEDSYSEQLNRLNTHNANLEKEILSLKQQLAQMNSAQDEKDFEIKKQWFMNGAIVLGIGLLLGLILPKLATTKRRANSWN